VSGQLIGAIDDSRQTLAKNKAVAKFDSISTGVSSTPQGPKEDLFTDALTKNTGLFEEFFILGVDRLDLKEVDQKLTVEVGSERRELTAVCKPKTLYSYPNLPEHRDW
jgi:hypothetical protein